MQHGEEKKLEQSLDAAIKHCDQWHRDAFVRYWQADRRQSPQPKPKSWGEWLKDWLNYAPP